MFNYVSYAPYYKMFPRIIFAYTSYDVKVSKH